MNESMVNKLDDQEAMPEPLEMLHPRPVGSPLPRGNGARVHPHPHYGDLEKDPPLGPARSSAPVAGSARGPLLAPPAVSPPASGPDTTPPPRPAPTPAPPPRRELARPAAQPTGFQRAVGALRGALPIVQKLLPLLEGNVATAVSNVLAPAPPRPPAPAPVDLSPVQQSIAELQTKHHDLREQVTEQNASLKRVEDRLEMVREATDRNTLEQQELLADLKSVGKRMNLVAAIAIGLLVISLLVNLALFRHILQVLP